MLRTNFLKKKLESGKPVLGTWSVIPSPIVADIISSSGIDFLIIDAEHGPISFETAQNMAIACESWDVSPVMRVGGVIGSEILRALDIGVHCIQIPNITSTEELEKALEYCKYPPLGNKGFSPFTRGGGYSHENARKIHDFANDNTLLAIHIEGKNALKNIDEMLTIDEVDIIFIGVYDLSTSLGIPGQVDSPLLRDLLKELTGKILAANKYPGSIVTSQNQLKEYMELGMKYITYSVDCEVLLKEYKNTCKFFREIQA